MANNIKKLSDIDNSVIVCPRTIRFKKASYISLLSTFRPLNFNKATNQIIRRFDICTWDIVKDMIDNEIFRHDELRDICKHYENYDFSDDITSELEGFTRFNLVKSPGLNAKIKNLKPYQTIAIIHFVGRDRLNYKD